MKNIKIISRQHCWRTLGGVITNDQYEYKRHLKNGCQLQNILFTMRNAEEMIIDLSNLNEPFSLMSSFVILTAWNNINNNINDYLNKIEAQFKNIRKITGYGLDPEIAISGVSKAELEEIVSIIISKTINHIDVYSVNNSYNARGIHKTRLMKSLPEDTVKVYDNFRYEYSKNISIGALEDCPTLHIQKIYENHQVWKEIKEIAKNKLFIISAGIPLALAYHAATQDKNIFFCEVHRQNDNTHLYKINEPVGIYPTPDKLNKESWVIIDKSYTGGSIQRAYKFLITSLGYDTNILKLSVFPKTLQAFSSSDFSIYAGRLIKVRQIIARLKSHTWHKQLLYFGEQK